MPEAFAVIGLTAVSILIGHLVQAIASLIEPALYWTWGGRPSERALDAGLGDRIFPADTGARIKSKLATSVGGTPTSRSLFLYAMQRAESSGSSRVTRFNALY